METDYTRAVAAARRGDPAPWVQWIAKSEKYGIDSNGVDETQFSSSAELAMDVRMTEGLSPKVAAALYAAIKKHHG